MKNDSGEHIGHRIKRAMDAANMGPKAVADHFGIKPPSVSDWIKFGRIDKSRVRGLVENHRVYLPWHRERVFRR